MKVRSAYFPKVICSIALCVLTVGILISGSGFSAQANATKIVQTSLYDFSNKISQERMMATINILADRDNARVSGSEGERQSAAYILKQFKTFGLETREQRFLVEANTLNSVKLSLNDVALPLIKDTKVMCFSTVAPKVGIKAEIISVSQGTEADYKEKDVKGKIVLVQRGGETFMAKVARAEGNGAVGVIFYDPKREKLLGTVGALSVIPVVSIPTETALKIESKLAYGSQLEAELLVNSSGEASTSQNVMGILKSKRNPEGKQIIVGAHYDGVDTPAANDNGSGTAVMMEIAKILTSEKIDLPYDIQFIAFGSEEAGLLGSSAYVYGMDNEEAKRTLALINLDMVGVGDMLNLCTARGQSTMPLLKQARQICEQLTYNTAVRETVHSDHLPFAYAGVPAITLYVTTDHNYHSDNDTPDKIQPDMLAKACNLGLTICTAYKEEL